MTEFTWIEKQGRGEGGDKFHSSWLIDGAGRAYARVDHPLLDWVLYTCNLFFSPAGAADGKPNFEEDRAYVDQEAARRYCECAARMAIGRHAANRDSDGHLLRGAA